MPSRQSLRLTRREQISWAIWPVIACLPAIGFLCLIRWNELLDTIKATGIGNVWEIFFSVFGVLYAIVVGLLILDALERLHELSATIQDEVSTIEDVWETVNYIDDSGENPKIKGNIKEALLKYVKSVREEEWKEMENVKEKGTITRGMSAVLKPAVTAVGSISIDGGINQIAVQALISKLADLTSHRSKRRELAQRVFHHPLHILIKFMSSTVVVGILFLEVKSLWVHVSMVIAIVTTLVTLHEVIRDLDNPYDGYWALSKEGFKNVQETIKGDTQMNRPYLS